MAKPFLKKNSNLKKVVQNLNRPHRSPESARLFRGVELLLEEVEKLKTTLKEFVKKNK